MSLLLLTLFISFALATEQRHFYSSSIYKNGKLYVYEADDISVLGSGLYIYNLKDGPISDTKPKVINMTNAGPAYTPIFLDLPPNLPKERSDQLWMLGAVHDLVIEESVLDEEYWTAQIVNDNDLKFDGGLIPKPDYENFPQSAFTATIANDANEYELHIIGGLKYIKENNSTIITNYHFKYEFNSGKWKDLSDKSRSKLPPVAYHKVVQADGSLILLGGLSQNYTKNGNFIETVPSNDATFIGISDIYKFDLSSEKWTAVNAKINLDADIYKRGLAVEPSLDIYDGKLLSYMSLNDFTTSDFVPKLATLDFRAKDWEWKWIELKNDGGTDNSLTLIEHQSLVINDQLLLIHGKYIHY
jgi:hypothetical protein